MAAEDRDYLRAHVLPPCRPSRPWIDVDLQGLGPGGRPAHADATTSTPRSPSAPTTSSCTAAPARPRAAGKRSTRSCARSTSSSPTRRCSCSRARPWGASGPTKDAPRVLIANSNLVGQWATWDEFRRLEALGLTMYGQMTAGSWIYIGTQGILQGTYETFVEACRSRVLWRRSPRARWILTARPRRHGRGAAAGGEDGRPVVRERSRSTRRASRSASTRGTSTSASTTSTRRCEQAIAAADAGKPVTIAVLANAAHAYPEIVRRKIVPDLVTEQTSAHDPLTGYVPGDLDLGGAPRSGSPTPVGYVRARQGGHGRRGRGHARDAGRGRRGVRLRQQHPRLRRQEAGCAEAFDNPGFVPAYIRPQFCVGAGRSAGSRSPAIRPTSPSPTRPSAR